MIIFPRRRFEKMLAGLSLITAIALAFTALLLSEEHDIAATTAMVVAQFLTLTATLLGFDYKFNTPKL